MTTADSSTSRRRPVRRVVLAVVVVALAVTATVQRTGQDAPTASSSGCAPGDRDAMATAVADQLTAIMAQDWTTALTFTTAAFRAAVDAAAFERIIVDGFPVVADAATSDATSCRTTGDGEASLLVTVEAADGARQDLVYLFELERRRWRIDGATPAARPDDDTMTV